MRIDTSLFFFFAFFFASCDKQVVKPITPNIDDGSPRMLWSKELADNTGFTYTKTQFINYNSTVVFGGTKDNSGILVGLNIDTGEQEWEYINENLPSSSGINTGSYYQFGAKGYMLDSPRNHYFLDIETGVTDEFETDLSFTRGQSGIGNRIFKTINYLDQDGKYSCIVENNLEDPEEFQDVFCPDYDFNHVYVTGYYGLASGRDVFVQNNDTLMLIGFLDATEVPDKLNSYWAVYNLSKDEWEIEKTLIFEEQGRQIGAVNYYNGLFYFNGGNDKLECWDPVLKAKIWSKEYAGGIIYNDDCNCLIIETNLTDETICLRPNTGEEIWKTPISANSQIHYQDGIIYFIGAGDGILHALDIYTGAELWSLESPDSSTWLWEINGIPARDGNKGKIFASSGKTGYCFEAVN